ncbi:MAG TPA: geranyl transferase [Gammaproteobacteria bacterium]|nr:geranyl transferase [Gammaproteobacteria bacterium]
MTHSLSERLSFYQAQVDKALLDYLPLINTPPARLHQAMHYVVFNGGKRIRPILVYAAGQAVETDLAALHAPASAVELIHAYSLTHDDLPAMDDDDLRRGKPTCHKAFDDATAILTGDALLTLAFDVLSQDGFSNTETRLKMIQLLARASGATGMVGGQAVDFYSVGKQLSLDDLKQMHALKTGALINASVLMGAYAGNASPEQIQSLSDYADCIGLSFQIRDDILDVEGDTKVIGKSQGADEALNKPTYPALLGLEGAKMAAKELHDKAMASLQGFDKKADTLRHLSSYIVERNN